VVLQATHLRAGGKERTVRVNALRGGPHVPGTFLVVADARALPFADGEFEARFSNSVIEHAGSYTDQVKVAQEITGV
jgi:ubiquinone/menaquinone biosynthesis C-methylase UbiE